jgi:O-antigen/teichoic acid export membrane protein
MIRSTRGSLPGAHTLSLGQLISSALSLLSTIIMARYCGPQIFALCVVFILIFNFLQAALDFGCCSWASRELAASRLTSVDFLKIRNSKFFLSLVFFVTIPMIDSKLLGENFFSSILFPLYPILWQQTNYLQQYLITKGKFSYAVSLQILERACWLLVFPISLNGGPKSISFIAPIIIGLFLHVILGEVILRRDLRNVSEDSVLPLPKPLLLFHKSKSFGMISTLSNIANLDSLLVAKFGSLETSAQYSLSVRFRNPLTLIFQAIATQLRPVAATMDKLRIRTVFLETRNLLILGSVAVFMFAVFALIFGNQVFGEEYLEINRVLFFGIISAIPQGLILVCTAFLAGTGNESKVIRIFSLSVPISLFLSWIFSILFGAVGLVIALLFLNFILFYVYFFSVNTVYRALQ